MTGLPEGMIRRRSPNQGVRACAPDAIIVHFTNMATPEAAVERLCCAEAGVSCHYVIAEDGRCWQLVEEKARAHHAGLGGWGRIAQDMNSHTIGIELANSGVVPFPEPQMRVLEPMLRGIMARWEIPPERVIGHSDMAPDRKDDPGPRFDWRRLARQGLAVWPETGERGDEDPGAFRALATAVGYRPEFSDEDVLKAVRLRFRPWARGPLGAGDIAVLRDVAARFPVDRQGADA
ncbi:N-acetylmuramoyl-L-alanine amidase [Roseovarius sp. SCSIO 43702]|uniref:N-acetylmuramoyl-L-alanine amidase n=1 Tax=Roseovarius sp. SCSIO 43702 TaxID=2823043 RepID=UPI0038F80B7A